MSDTDAPKAPVKARRIRKRVIVSRAISLLFGLVVSATLVCLVMLVLAVMGRSLPLPDWAVEKIETQLNEQMTQGRNLSVEGISFGLRDANFRPTFDLDEVVLTDAKDRPLISLPQLRAQFDTSELLLGRVAIETLDFSGAKLRLERSVDGQVSLGIDSPGGDTQTTRSLDKVLARVDTFFDDTNLREFEELRADGVVLDMRDQRAGQNFLVEDGTLRITNTANELSAIANFNLAINEDAPALLHFEAEKLRGQDGAKLVAKFEDLNAQALSAQVTALSWLDVLDAPVAGALTAQIGAAGHVTDLFGTLNIAEGMLTPNETAKPLPFEAARTYIQYSAETGRLHFDEISIEASELRIRATGHADLRDLEAGLPKTILAQLRVSDLRLAPDEMFETPVEFDSGVLDLRYRPDELRIDVGQLLLSKEGAEISAKGFVAAQDAGWQLALDAHIPDITADTILNLWPVSAAPPTRKWLVENLLEGDVRNANAALRLNPGETLGAAVTFDFHDAKVRYLKSLPAVENAAGYFTLLHDKIDVALHQGTIKAPDGTLLQAGGSYMNIPSLNDKPIVSGFDVNLTGPLSGALHMLDEQPFEFLKKSGLATDMADGSAAVDLKLSVPFKTGLTIDQVGYEVAANILDMTSETLVAGRSLSADNLALRAGSGSLEISGPAVLDEVPAEVTWSRAIGPGSGERSKITAQMALTQDSLRRFGVTLPPGSVTGRGTADVEIDLVRGVPPQMRLSSDLAGVGLRIDALDYRKAQSSTGDLRLSMRLGDRPRVEGFTITANGLQADGRIELTDEGQLARAVFTPLRVGNKLNSRVEVIGQGAGNQVRLAVRGGTIDIRKFGFGDGPSRAGPPLDLALNKLVITDSISLDNFTGQFRNDRGLEGRFRGVINGAAEVEGVVAPARNGVAIRIRSAEGGAVLRGTGLFRNAQGGSMNLILRPNGEPGQFNGRLEISEIRVKKAPALADLLSAISVIGLLEQLSGRGILFQTVEADFVLTPSGVRLRNSSAVGPSMGISMQGVYNGSTSQMDMQGVVSPIYAVNGLFGQLLSPRRGEGLFGFNYTLKGTSDEPRVGVNPLSVFTPGIFREIFRQPVPQLPN